MSALQQALLFSGAVLVQPPTNLRNLHPSSAFSTSSTTYVNLLDASAGSPITVSLTKGASSNILIAMGGAFSLTGIVTLGANDGTTDYDVACKSQQNFGSERCFDGERIITGLGAGAVTFTARVKVSTSTLTFNTTYSMFIRILEVDP